MEGVKTAARANVAGDKTSLKNAAVHAVYLGLGFLVSRGAVLGNLAPFGASFVAAVPSGRIAPALIGTALGYVVRKPEDSFRYVAVVIAVAALRWLFSELDFIRRSRLFAPLTACGTVFATGAAALFGSEGDLHPLTDCVIEAVLAGAAAYFMAQTVRLSGQRRGISAFTEQEGAAVVLTGCVLLLSLGSVEIEGISLGRILAVLAVLLCARYGGVAGGSVSGAAAGAVFSLAREGQGYLCGGFAFGGLVAGVFAPLGKFACALSFLLSHALMSLAFGQERVLPSVLIESFIGSVTFLLLPKEVGNVVAPVFQRGADASLGESLRRSVVMRLDFTAKAIANVKNDVKNVSEKLGELYSPTFEWVCENVARDVCGGCGLRMYCYEHEGGVTRDDFFRLEEVLAEKRQISDDDVEAAFVKNCCKKGEIAAHMSLNYRRLLAAREAQRRVAELRGVVAGQFAGVSDILHDLAADFNGAMRSDEDSAARLTEALSAEGFGVADCVCLTGANGRMTVELELAQRPDTAISQGRLAREVSKCCGRRFDLPTLSFEGGRVRAALCEMPLFDAEIGTDQHIADGGKLCGDCLDYFNDGLGNTYALVCDGMGTGGRAAVDGNMAVSVMGRLLRAGLSPDSSLQIVNSALMIKSEDESLSTVDLAGIDLYTGGVTLKKAGAPLTYIKKGGRLMTREMPSLPAGILNNVKFSTETIQLNAGDLVVMVSDGVMTGDEKWLERLIRTWNEGSAQDLAQAVVQEAIRRRAATKDDDITAVAIRLTENE